MLVGEARQEADEVRAAVGDLVGPTPRAASRARAPSASSASSRLASERAGRRDGAPRPGLAHGLGDPHARRASYSLSPGQRREVLHEVEERVGERRAPPRPAPPSARSRREPRRPTRCRAAGGGRCRAARPARAAASAPSTDRELDVARAHRELLARLALGGVRLVDDPVAQRRQDAALRDHVAEEQRVVGDDDVRARGAPAHAVQVAQVREVAAALLRAVRLRGLDRRAQLALAPVQVDRVQVAPARLRRPRVQRADRGERVGVRGRRVELAGVALELAQARVVVVALERDVAQLAAERLVQRAAARGRRAGP